MKKILVAQAARLLGAAILSLLYHECDLNVIGCMADTATELIEEIERLHPDVVIIDQASHFTEAIHLLPAPYYFKLRLLMVSTENDLVNIDREESILISECADLAHIIRYGQS
ncbi:MAG: hypothetical protein NT075_11130 [Chloroflexi bacterium]|nr:hypothetical protein [Chloroflexota bacterium]